jgi:hypothetical protein
VNAAQLASLCPPARRVGCGRWQCRCPGHGDRSPSLSIREGRDGRVILYDFGGCSTARVLQALNLTWSDLFVDRWAFRRPLTSPRLNREARERQEKAERQRARYAMLRAQYRETAACFRWLDQRSDELAAQLEQALGHIDNELRALERQGIRGIDHDRLGWTCSVPYTLADALKAVERPEREAIRQAS